jgi:hypothetical protein
MQGLLQAEIQQALDQQRLVGVEVMVAQQPLDQAVKARSPGRWRCDAFTGNHAHGRRYATQGLQEEP